MIENTDDPQIYQNLCLIIDAFETAALESGTREGFLVVANGPLTGMDNMMSSSDKALNSIQSSREDSNVDSRDLSDTNDSGFNLDFDADLAEIFGQEDNPVRNYVEECLNCDLRLQFDWQLKPLNLLGGIDSLIQGINEILDAFQIQLDPYKSLEGICDLLNNLKGLCIPDLILVLISLKLLLKKYISDSIEIKLDWTVILGPLLKGIVDGIASLLEGLIGIILAPIDCALTSLYAANELERQARELAGQVGAFASGTKDIVDSIRKGELPPGVDIDATAEDYTWAGSTLGDTVYPEAPHLGTSRVTGRELEQGDPVFKLDLGKDDGSNAALTIPTGFTLTKDTRLADALKDPNFVDSTITEKLIIPVQDAKYFIQDLLGNILQSLRSLEVLVSGGLSVQMGNIGLLLFLADLISLVVMIIKMLQINKNVTDWCSFLEENPEILEEALNSRYSRSLSKNQLKVESGGNNTLLLREGPDIVAEISTCASKRSTSETEIIQQWIQDLSRKGTS
jgi:hypothetical protein